MEIMIFCLFCGYMSLEAWWNNTQEMLISKHKMKLASFIFSLSLKPEIVPDIQYYKKYSINQQH